MCLWFGKEKSKPGIRNKSHIQIHNILISYRKENNRVVDLLSDESKRKRYRRYAVSIQNTIISWLLEFATNLMILIVWFLGVVESGNRRTIETIMYLDAICCFVLIPSSYIVNTNDFKSYLLASQCYVSFIDRFRSNRVNPVKNEKIQMGVMSNHAPDVVIVAKEIPTPIANEFLSGNIPE